MANFTGTFSLGIKRLYMVFNKTVWVSIGAIVAGELL